MTNNFSKVYCDGNDSIFRPDIGGIAQLREIALSSKSKSACKTSIGHFNDFLCQTTFKHGDINE